MNRTRASSLEAFGLRDQRNRIYPALEASDGSTLSLDFTQMSSLDSRFTFTRITPSGTSTTATFINSSGNVVLADHNLAVNSTWTDSNTTPTGWTIFNTGGTPNIPAVVTIPETGKRSITVSNESQSFLYQAKTVSPGLPYTLSLVVHSVSGNGPTAANLIAFNGAVAAPGNGAILYYKDGVSVGALGGNTRVTPGTWSAVFSGGNQIRLLQGAGPADNTYTIVVSAPQLQQGVALLPVYVPNSSTSSAYQAPRFDYNPTTLTARGLLIEGSATNLLARSEDMANATFPGWGTQTNLNTTGISGQASPDGATTAVKIIPNTTNGAHYLATNSLTLSNSTQYTLSVFVKPSGYGVFGLVTTNNQARASFTLATNSSSSYGLTSTRTITAYPNGWYRVSMSWTTTQTGIEVWLVAQNTQQDPVTSWSGNNTDSVTVWGAQLELGAQASSYIPTGSSSVARARDGMTMADISTLNFNQSGGTVFMRLEENPRDKDTFAYFGQFEVSPSGRGWAFARFNNSSSAGRRMVPIAFSGPSTTLISSSTVTRSVSGEYKFATTLEPSVAQMTVVVSGGSPVVTTATAGTLTTIGALKFNNTTESDSNGIDFSSVWIAQFKYWPSVLPNATLQTLTL